MAAFPIQALVLIFLPGVSGHLNAFSSAGHSSFSFHMNNPPRIIATLNISANITP
jgi:hypothetical protein